MAGIDSGVGDDPRWYEKALIYQTHVRAFLDSDGDGVGDFAGLSSKLGYIRDLGATAIWLLPFYRSPLRDGGYDIADYMDVNPDYGSLADVKTFIQQAHDLGIRVITELVLNHTSDAHAWFQRARHAEPGSEARDFYVWSATPDRFAGTRIIFKDFESSNWSWDPVAKAYYWHRFYAHQPDLNWDNPAVRAEMLKVLDFWLGLGVDGLRLDAVPYLIQREGTSCENLPETHDILKDLRKHVDANFDGRMLLAEANQWPEDAAAYFGDGDECHMNFHFPLMPRLFMAIQAEDRFGIIDILDQTPALPSGCQWAIFLRNHDELTLEMVTDEERDAMYRAYAPHPRARINLGVRRRLAPLLGNDRRKIELINGLLLSMKGTPIVYYGDEIGMGDNIWLDDRDGVRTPMQWSADRNAGFSTADPRDLYLPVVSDPSYRFESINVAAQQGEASSLHTWMKRTMQLRQRYDVFGCGSQTFLAPDNQRILAYLREDERHSMLVVANLSATAQWVDLDLSQFEGRSPKDVFGGTRFPRVDAAPYRLSLGPYGFFWLDLTEARCASATAISLPGGLAALCTGAGSAELAAALPAVLHRQRWFGGKAQAIEQVEIDETFPLPTPSAPTAVVALATVRYEAAAPEVYALTLAYAEGDRAKAIGETHPELVLLPVNGEDAVLYDATADPEFARMLLRGIEQAQTWPGRRLAIRGAMTSSQRRPDVDLTPVPLGAEQSNSAIVFGDQLFAKLFRRLEPGVNPDCEVCRHLTDNSELTSVPKLIGALEITSEAGEPSTLAMLQSYVPNDGDAWQFTCKHLGRYLRRFRGGALDASHLSSAAAGGLLGLAELGITDEATEVIGPYLQAASVIGTRTAELHCALAKPSADPAFAPEALTRHGVRSMVQSMRNLTIRTFQLLQKRLPSLAEDHREAATVLLARRPEVLERFQTILQLELTGLRTRIHGDYHLGQLLHTGEDFVISDFEGEPMQTLSARRLPQSPLKDVAAMMRSFNYAAHATLATVASDNDGASLGDAARFWVRHGYAAFLSGYLEVADAAEPSFLPKTRQAREALLYVCVLGKAIYELQYELDHRPSWVPLPIAGINELLDDFGCNPG